MSYADLSFDVSRFIAEESLASRASATFTGVVVFYLLWTYCFGHSNILAGAALILLLGSALIGLASLVAILIGETRRIRPSEVETTIPNRTEPDSANAA